MFPGFVDRLESEIVNLAPANTTVSVVAPSDRQLATWLGGSILSSLQVFRQMLVTKEEYEEKGPSAIQSSKPPTHRLCVRIAALFLTPQFAFTRMALSRLSMAPMTL
jgi:hypothetical protein